MSQIFCENVQVLVSVSLTCPHPPVNGHLSLHHTFIHRDTYNEIMVAVVKKAIKNQHTRIQDLQIQCLIQSLSVMTALHDRNLKARLYTTAGMQRSRDLVGQERRQILRDAISDADPFNLLSRELVTDASVKSKGTPFTVSEVDLKKFIRNAKANFKLHYPSLA